MKHQQDAPAQPELRPWSKPLSRVSARTRWAAPFAMGVMAAFIALVLYGVAVPGPRPLTQQDVTNDVSQAIASVTPGPALSEIAYQAIQPSVVLIETQVTGGTTAARGTTSVAAALTATASATPTTKPIATASAASSAATTGNLGSGVVVDASGDILTCLHVVADATSIQVTFADGTKSPAEITTTQPQNDIAVLQASQPPAKLVPAVLGNPRSVHVGSEAFVVGNPFGLDGSISSGVVSGLNRSFQLPNDGPLLQGLIQVDAAVNPGDSGGPLVNRDGQVIGIVSALVNPTNGDFFIGIGLAEPIDVAGGAAGLPPD